MHRTQIYFEELKRQVNTLGVSLSAYIRDTLKKDLEEKKRDTTQASLREKAWK